MKNQPCLPTAKPPVFIRLLKRVMSVMGRVTICGIEHLEGPSGKIVVCNHVGWADPLWMGYAVFPRPLHQMAKKELFNHPIGRWLVRSGGGFPVDRGRTSAATIKHVIALVEQGQLVLIYPSGTRGRDNAEAKRGAATIALRAGGDIVPAHYEGPRQLRLRDLLRRPRIRITFGAPLAIPEMAAANKEAALALTEELEQAMTRLGRIDTAA